jgi:formylglycine-generating enzyme required for sulfatase activity
VAVIDVSTGTGQVMSKLVSSAGLYDMSGNLYEYCQEIYSGTNRVVRGYGWNSAVQALSGRVLTAPSLRNHSNGFRLAGPTTLP